MLMGYEEFTESRAESKANIDDSKLFETRKEESQVIAIKDEGVNTSECGSSKQTLVGAGRGDKH